MQGKGYMKTYWLKGKKDLSFKTPAELRYSSEQKDSEDKSSNGWVDKRRAVSTKESLFLCTQGWTRDAPCWFSRSCAHHPLQHQTASKTWKAVFSAFVCLKESCWPPKTKFSLRRGSTTLREAKKKKPQKTITVRQIRQHSTGKTVALVGYQAFETYFSWNWMILLQCFEKRCVSTLKQNRKPQVNTIETWKWHCFIKCIFIKSRWNIAPWTDLFTCLRKTWL